MEPLTNLYTREKMNEYIVTLQAYPFGEEYPFAPISTAIIDPSYARLSVDTGINTNYGSSSSDTAGNITFDQRNGRIYRSIGINTVPIVDMAYMDYVRNESVDSEDIGFLNNYFSNAEISIADRFRNEKYKDDYKIFNYKIEIIYHIKDDDETLKIINGNKLFFKTRSELYYFILEEDKKGIEYSFREV